MRKITLLCMLLALTSLTGCATVFGDRYNHVNLTTTPAGAEYEIRNGADSVVASGVTPNLVKLKSSAGYFKRGTYNVRFSKAGYEDVQVPLTAACAVFTGATCLSVARSACLSSTRPAVRCGRCRAT